MKYIFYIITSLILISSCQTKKTNTEQPDTNYLQNTSTINSDTINLNLSESIVTWIGSKPTGQHDGIIELKDGFVVIAEGNLLGGAVTIDINSLKVMDLQPGSESHQKLTNHLMSADFFDAATFPNGSFTLSGIQPYDTSFQHPNKKEFPSKYQPASAERFTVKDPNCIIVGSLLLRGVSNDILFPAKINYKENTLSVEAKFNIDRTLWNLSYGDEASIVDKVKDKFIYNTINVGFYIEAPLSK